MEIVKPSRRGFLGGFVALIAAPAIVPFSSLMPISGGEVITLSHYGNQLLTLDMITREAVKLFADSNAFIRNINRQFDDEFGAVGAKIGSTLRIRLPNDYALADSKSMWQWPSDAPQIDSKLALAAAAPFVAAKALEAPVTRRFWGSL